MYRAVDIIVITMVVVFWAYDASATCTKTDYEEMRAAGFSAEEIRNICFPENNKSSMPSVQQQPMFHDMQMQQKMGQNCQTVYGVCTLAHLPPAPIGTPCYCVNRFTGMSDPGHIAY